MREEISDNPVSEVIKMILDKTGYVEELRAKNTPEDQARIENLDEFISKAVSYEEMNENASLSGFLEEVALVADIDNVEDSDNTVLLMTLHSSKGLEFPYVYLTGMEEGVFPGYMSMEDDTELEEERRLAYVGITRAKKSLTLTSAAQRLIRGEVVYNPVSRFIREIPKQMLDLGVIKERERPVSFARGGMSEMREAISGDSRSTGTGRSFASSATRKSSTNVNSGNPYSSSSRKFGVNAGAGSLDYSVGDTVIHKKFGEGIVRDIVSGGRDFEVTVDFTGVGTKKMFASFANLKKK